MLLILMNMAMSSNTYSIKWYVQNVGEGLELSWAGVEGWLLF